MNRALLVATGIVLGLAVAGQAVPSAYAKKKDPAKIKAARQKIWDKYTTDKGGMVFKTMDYWVDVAKLKDSRWSRNDKAKGYDGKELQYPQVSAQWATPNSEGWAISIVIWKAMHSPKPNTTSSRSFENIGKKSNMADVGKICEYTWEEWIAKSKDVITKQCKKPGKAKGAGPASKYASATATDSETKQRERRDWYFWADGGATYEALVRFDQSVLKNDGIIEKAKKFMSSIKPLKEARKLK
jgi:hypothetical protein